MISRTPDRRMLYDARLKFQRDEDSPDKEVRKTFSPLRSLPP